MARERARKRRGRGEGGVHFREADGLWVGSLSLGYTADGRRRRKVVYANSKREALESLAQARAEAGLFPDSFVTEATVADAVTSWLASNRTSVEALTHAESADVVRLHLLPRIGHLRLGNLRPEDIADYYQQMRDEGVGRRRTHQAATCLVATLKHAVKRGLLRTSPASDIPLPKRPTREMVCLTAPQSLMLLAAATDKPVHDLLLLALASGCRQGELLALHYEDIDFATAKLTVRRTLARRKRARPVLKEPKTRASKRTISLPEQAISMLRARRQAARFPLVFCSRTGNFLNGVNVTKSLGKCVQASNNPGRTGPRGGRPRASAPSLSPAIPLPVNLRFHDLRHTHASLLLSAGHSIRAVSARLGHTDPGFTLRVYAHCLPGDDERLAQGIAKILGS